MTYSLYLTFVPLLVLEAFFAAAEIALVSANRRRLHHLADEGDRGAGLALKLLARPEFFLATTLLGAYMAAAANTVSFGEDHALSSALSNLITSFSPSAPA